VYVSVYDELPSPGAGLFPGALLGHPNPPQWAPNALHWGTPVAPWGPGNALAGVGTEGAGGLLGWHLK